MSQTNGMSDFLDPLANGSATTAATDTTGFFNPLADVPPAATSDPFGMDPLTTQSLATTATISSDPFETSREKPVAAAAAAAATTSTAAVSEPPDADFIEMAKEDGHGFVNPLAANDLEKGIPLEDKVPPSTFSPKSGQPNSNSSVEFDQIESSPVPDVAPGGGNLKEVFCNATDFLVEHNANYSITWDEAAYKISEVAEDPSRPPIPGWNWPYTQWFLRRVIESFFFRVFTMLLIVFDICIVIADLATQGSRVGNSSMSVFSLLDLIITIYFVVEIILRIVALSYPVFFATWYNVVDFAVVVSTFIIVCVAAGGSDWAETLSIFTVLRFVRIFRLVRLYTEKKQIETAARQLVSQNKRRYQQDGFDLDLTYVTGRVIATSFPSSGLWSLYRNPIDKVAAFLDAKHPGKYRLYNLCSEKTYQTHHFHERVERFMIDDHNVPSLDDMRRFADSVKSWLSQDPDNVIVVHCKGGKGRTGTMICVWLVEAGVFTNANSSLQYFGQRRTDTNVGTKFQGVETPSQSRYVGYFETMRNQFGGRVPPPTKVVLKGISVHGMMYVGQGNGDDFWFTVTQGRSNQVFSAHLGFRRNCSVHYDAEADVLNIDGLGNCPPLEGDVRILFQTSSRTVPKGYEGCPFYFWFNCSMLDGSGKLVLNREDLDNPHKSKTWHCFRPSFKVEVQFEQAK